MAKKTAPKRVKDDGFSAIVVLILSIISLLSFFVINGKNILGPFGAILGRSFYLALGYAAIVLPFIGVFYAVNMLRKNYEFNATKPAMSFIILVAAVAILFTVSAGGGYFSISDIKSMPASKAREDAAEKETFKVQSDSLKVFNTKEQKEWWNSLPESVRINERDFMFYRGGIMGHYASSFLNKWLNIIGTFITALIMIMISIILFGKEDFLIAAWKFIADVAVKVAKGIGHGVVVLFEAIGGFISKAGAQEKKKEPKAKKQKEELGEGEEEEEDEEEIPKIKEKPKKGKVNVIAAKEKPKGPVSIQSIVKGDFKLPPSDFLHAAPEKTETTDYTADAELLKATLEEFGIEGEIVSVIDGPVISRFEIDLATGIKVSQVENLAPDIALAMKAEQVRVASVSDKGLLGIEVPKRNRKTIVLKDLIEDETFQKADSLLTIAIGRDLGGNPIIANLAEMPHFLIAGSTGSGKSVCINTIIMSILYKASPDEVKLVLVDPKQVELTHYRDLPHLIAPVITDPKHAAYVLKKLVYEMKARYDILAAEGAQNIIAYNKIVEDYNHDSKKDKDLKPEEMKKSMPYIVLVIDELADLMTMAKSTVEESLQRLAQLARAVGIHLVLATQRPSVDVITGVIKANFPSRVAFKVKSQVDSRTILDTKGAESLIGKGDMLYAPQDKIKPVRGQGALVTAQEISKVVHFINKQRKPEISEEFKFRDDIDILSGKGFDDDPVDSTLLERAKLLAKEKGTISTSYLQRKMGIGYSKAARLIDDMEEKGLVSGADGNKPREYIGD